MVKPMLKGKRCHLGGSIGFKTVDQPLKSLVDKDTS